MVSVDEGIKKMHVEELDRMKEYWIVPAPKEFMGQMGYGIRHPKELFNYSEKIVYKWDEEQWIFDVDSNSLDETEVVLGQNQHSYMDCDNSVHVIGYEE